MKVELGFVILETVEEDFLKFQYRSHPADLKELKRRMNEPHCRDLDVGALKRKFNTVGFRTFKAGWELGQRHAHEMRDRLEG